MALFTVEVKDAVTRQHIIQEKCRSPLRKELFHQYLQGGIELPVISLEISLPVYRMANWRTRTKQLAYVHDQALTPEYFQTGEENVGPQRVQHGLLVEFANRGRGESVLPIIDKLRQDRLQQESLLITSAGVVVNGNRRLAAMRELFAEDPSFPFAHVQCMVLPPAVTAQELKKIEFQLQMQPETKLPYDWAIQCLSVRELALAGVPHAEICHMMRLDRVEDVQVLISRLNEAELYLSEYLETPDNYAAIERQEQQFIELEKALSRKHDAGEKELARRLCYVITRHSRDLDTRAYDFKIAFGKETQNVAERLAARLDVPLEEPPAGTEDEDVFGGDEGTCTRRFEPVKQLLADKSKSEVIAEAIADICEEIREETRGSQDATRALKYVKRARALLDKVEVDEAGPETVGETLAELAEVIELAEWLRERFEERPTEAD